MSFVQHALVVVAVGLVACAGPDAPFADAEQGGSAGLPLVQGVGGGGSSSLPGGASSLPGGASSLPGGASSLPGVALGGSVGVSSGSGVALGGSVGVGGSSASDGSVAVGVACSVCVDQYNACSTLQSQTLNAFDASCQAAAAACDAECVVVEQSCWQGCVDAWYGVNAVKLTSCRADCTASACITTPCTAPPVADCSVALGTLLNQALSAICQPALATCRATCT